AIKQLEGGRFSRWANEVLKPGDEIDVMTPTGRFFVPLDPAAQRHHVFVAAGSGITPVLSLLSTTLEVERRSRCTLVYGNRTTSTVMFLEELQDLKNSYRERFQLINVLSRETQDVDLFNGRIERGKLDQLLATLIPPDGVDEWYLCGPFSMVEIARATLLEYGVDAAHVHLELFHVEGEPVRIVRDLDATSGADASTSTVTIVLDGRSTTFELAPYAGSILDAALKARGDAPYACKGGVCGTCRAKLVDGTVEMDRNYALEADEIAAGVVLACQSHPTSPTVTLDFDQ
ncbi:MAG TPA: 2Fe-2S iron-sulfur cluster-binding protein, partial [Mycobacteriales bacterium]|nr:2Fe-2S iron-sulfur cluster-binding protein [Mycobacteriales bacterium]